MRYSLRLLSGGIAALDHRLIAPNLSGSGETISITRSWRVGRGFVKCRATPSLRNLLAGIRWPRSIPSKTAKNLVSHLLILVGQPRSPRIGFQSIRVSSRPFAVALQFSEVQNQLMQLVDFH